MLGEPPGQPGEAKKIRVVHVRMTRVPGGRGDHADASTASGGVHVSRQDGLVSRVTGLSRRMPGEAQPVYARTPVPRQPADPSHNRMDWEGEIWPAQPGAAVPPGFLLVKVANAIATSGGNAVPGSADVFALPDAEARDLLRQGLAREVRTG